MDNNIVEQGYRRFLKGSQLRPYTLGGFFPERIVGSEEQKIDFSWVKNVRCGTVVFIMSANCSACNFQPIGDYVMNYPDFNYVMLFDGNDSLLNDYCQQYELSIPAVRCNMDQIYKQLNIDTVPWVLVLNSVGQIVAAGLFNHSEHLTMITKPLLSVFYATSLPSLLEAGHE